MPRKTNDRPNLYDTLDSIAALTWSDLQDMSAAIAAQLNARENDGDFTPDEIAHSLMGVVNSELEAAAEGQ